MKFRDLLGFDWLMIGLMFVMSLGVPFLIFYSDHEGIGLPLLFLGLGTFIDYVGGFFDFDKNKILKVFTYGISSVGVILLVRLGFLYLRDLFVKDPRSATSEALVIPVAVVIYALIYFPLVERINQDGLKIVRRILTIVIFLIVSGLVYLIYR